MSSWGAGLYSSDFARDLRSTIRAVSRLPFEPARLMAILCETEPTAAFDTNNEDHTTFWLVIADQFARLGIASSRAKEAALDIIASAQDLEMQRKLGQNQNGLARRRQILDELRERLQTVSPRANRATLREPQSFLMNVGDALIYPTCGGRCRNPYVTRPERLKIHGPRGGEPWRQDGWGAIVVAECGRAFGFFSWYRPLVSVTALTHRPDLEMLRDTEFRLALPGTCTPRHFRRMELEKAGTFPIDVARLHQLFPHLRSGDSQAIQDISISNRMTVRSPDAHHRQIRQANQDDRRIRVQELGVGG